MNAWRTRHSEEPTIDSVRDDAAMRAADLDRLRHDLRALEDENARLRQDAAAAAATWRRLEHEVARQSGELADIYASRAWHVAQMLRRTFRRRPPTPPRPALPAAPGAADAADPVPADVTLIVPPAGADAVAHCNAAAANAGTEFVALWDGVSRPRPGWLAELVLALQQSDDAGMAGALLLAPDGRIAAAGAIIEAEGRLAPRGAGAHPADPAYASVAPVQALPLGAVLLRTDTWRRFGGLDPEIAYPEQALADLAERLHAAGSRVVCQPFARLAAAAPAQADSWAAAYGRWRLRGQRARGGNGLGLPPPAAPRVLFVDNLVPTPDRDAASIDMAVYLRIFVGLGYETTLLPAGDLGRGDRYVDDLRRAGVRVVANHWVGSAEQFLAAAPAPFDLVFLYRASLAPLFDRLRAHSPNARIAYNTVDLHFLRMEREALLHRAPDKLDAAFLVQQRELATIARADCSVLLSPAEQKLIAALLPRARTCVIPIARPVAGSVAPFAKRHGAVFVGGFRHGPNVDAVLAFVRETWPLVRARLPSATFAIVGADPPDDVLALADPAQGVAVLGHVADLDAVLAQCRLTVAPLRFGAGTKGKIVTSLAAGVPCVASPIAAEGMGLTDRQTVRVAATPEAFAAAVVEVHEDAAIWATLSEAGRDVAAAAFSVDEVRRRLIAMLRDLGLPAGAPPPSGWT